MSWDSQRAKTYRKLNQFRPLGHSCKCSSYGFGNMGDDCSTGVAFTRNPSTGENSFFGEFLINAQVKMLWQVQELLNTLQKSKTRLGLKRPFNGGGYA